MIDFFNSRAGVLVQLTAVGVVTLIGVIAEPAQTLVIVGFGGAITSVLMSILKQGTIETKLDTAADKVTEVKTALVVSDAKKNVKLDKLADMAVANQVVTDLTHDLVNSAMQVALENAAKALRRVAVLTNDPADLRAAAAAEADLATHNGKQEQADAICPPKGM